MSLTKADSKVKPLVILTVLFALTLGGLAYVVTPYMLIASASYFLMILGIVAIVNKETLWHVRLMSTAMGVDILLVLILEFQRDAIATAASFALTPLQLGHIGTSTLATVLYIPTFVLGYKRWKKKLVKPSSFKWHLRTGIAAFVFRTLGFILMFTLLSHVQK